MPKILYSKLADYYDYIVQAHTNTKKEVDFLDKLFREKKVSKILDIACGTGRHCIGLAKLGYDVSGVDISEEMIRVAKKKSEERGVTVSFFTDDVRNLSFNGDFDAVICMWATFYYLPQPLTIEKVSKALKMGGVFVLDCKDWEEIDKSPNEYPEREIKAENVILKQTMSQMFEGNKRIRRFKYRIGKDTFFDDDVCITYSLEEIKRMLEKHGMKIEKIFFNWKFDKKDEKSYSRQLVARKIA